SQPVRAPQPEPPTAAAPVPHLLCRELRSLPESPPPHTRYIRRERKSHAETTDGAAALPAAATPDSAALHHAADFSASIKSSLLHPESAWPPQSPRPDPVRARRIWSPPVFPPRPGMQQLLRRIPGNRRAVRRRRPCAAPPVRRFWPFAAHTRNPDLQIF